MSSQAHWFLAMVLFGDFIDLLQEEVGRWGQALSFYSLCYLLSVLCFLCVVTMCPTGSNCATMFSLLWRTVSLRLSQDKPFHLHLRPSGGASQL